ncbi:BTB/POZ domain-containing protein At4g08455-like [Acropora millepora]|uniref:BTB/POZ domain-containing protein At4g08455-like n=1 Tax=Acropora millepora TaxID=45264 RepID=UPI001CF2C809|nr:BTB/POZ domain-containing protein At4g08455-like [Acropora millepora]
MYTSRRKEQAEIEQDFSQPWEQSDLVLLVEGKPLHVHRLILSMSSPVFSRMFGGDFKEKTARTIPLPGKKYDQVREMLLAIYPTAWKSITKLNCDFLLILAHEYQMTHLIKKCESYLLENVAGGERFDFLDLLVLAQKFDMKRLLDECIKKTERLSLEELKSQQAYKEIEPLYQLKMIELQMDKVRKENARLKTLAREARDQWESIVCILASHANNTNDSTNSYRTFSRYTEESLKVVMNDQFFSDRKGRCQSLHRAYDPLKTLQSKLNDMSS